MTTENHTQVMTALGRIEQKIDSHLGDDDKVHDRQDGALNDLTIKVNATEKTLARHKGVGIGAIGVMSTLLAVIKLDFWR